MVLQRGRPVEGQQTEAALEQVGGHKVPDHQVRLVIVKKQKQMRSGSTKKPNNSIATADVPYV